MTLAQRVKEHRYAKGWGPDELANRAEISRTALYQIESGKTEQPRASTLRRIALALEVPTDVLLGQAAEIASNRRTLPVAREADAAPRPHFRLDDDRLDRVPDLDRKFRELLASPLGEGVARIVEESYRILPHTFSTSGW